MGRSNRRKTAQEPIVVLSTSTSGTTGLSDAAANADAVSFYIAIATATAGSITFKIQTAPDEAGVVWFDLATSEMTGNTGALTTAGNYHVSAQVPFGMKIRLAYTIVTGPFAFVVYPVYERSGGVY